MNAPSPQLLYYDIAPGVTAFSTTRHGGVSLGAYGELNINAYCGDDEGHVARNRELLAKKLGLPPTQLIVPHQTHGVETLVVDNDFLALPAERRALALEGVDAVMTHCQSVCVGVSTADCIPVLIYDETHHVVAAAHAGWRGTVNHVVTATLERMATLHGTRPQDVRAVVGPGISVRNFEVGQEVYDAFRLAGHDMGRIAKRYGKWHIDLPLCNKLQMESWGVPAENVTMSGICTYEAEADWFSARRLGIASGRIYNGLILR